jgi:hypothetical protein
VMSGSSLVEMADPARVQVLLRAANVRVIRRHRREIVELQLLDFGNSYRISPKWGNAQKLSTNLETPDNPARVWTLKKVRGFGVAPERPGPHQSGTTSGATALPIPIES